MAAILGGSPAVTSLSTLSSTQTSSRTRTSCCSFYASSNNLNLRTSRHLAAFQPPSPLFSSRPNVITRHKPLIFLPHLVASMEQVEETYIMIKPDGVQRGLVGEIITRFEKKGFKLSGLKLFQCPQDLAEEHYKDLKSKPFFPKLIDYITSGPVVCMAWEGIGVVASARKLIGSTNPLQAEPGTIRGDLAVQTGRNVVHGSDSPENGQREIGNAFVYYLKGGLCGSKKVKFVNGHQLRHHG